MHRHVKRNLAIGTTALAAAAFTGGAYAATQDGTNNMRQAFVADVAKRLHVTPQQLTAALRGAADDQLNADVKAGKLTQAQANAIKKRLAQGVPMLLPYSPLPLARPALPFPPPAGMAVPPRAGKAVPPAAGKAVPPPMGKAIPLRPGQGRPGFLLGSGHSPLGAAAKYLGLTGTQLFDQLRAGKTLSQIAQSRGKSVAGLKQAMFGAEKGRLDQAVKDKMITPAQEQQALSKLRTAISGQISRSFRPLWLGARLRGSSAKGAPAPNGRMFRLVPVPPNGPEGSAGGFALSPGSPA